MIVDSVAFLELSTMKLNTLRRHMTKNKLLDHLRQIAKDAVSDSTYLYGDDINKRLSQIAAFNKALLSLSFILITSDNTIAMVYVNNIPGSHSTIADYMFRTFNKNIVWKLSTFLFDSILERF